MDRREFLGALAASTTVPVTLGADRQAPAPAPKPLTVTLLGTGTPAPSLTRQSSGYLIEIGTDLIVWDPDAESSVDPAALYHRHPVTPYAGLRLRGRVVTTLVRGETVRREGTWGTEPLGQALLSGR